MAINRREFFKTVSLSSAALAMAQLTGACKTAPGVPGFADELAGVLANVEIKRRKDLRGRQCSYFCDDVIWALRDVTRERPKSVFDHPFFAVLKECHEKYGLKLELNLLYRIDFFHGMDEFTLSDVTADYKAEFAAAADWLKFGFHSLQEIPDYPWGNASYADVKRLFNMIRAEVVRFAGFDSFALACVPHLCSMSKDGVRALKESGIRVMECSAGPHHRCDGRDYLIFSNHEQYFFKDYFACRPEYAAKVRLMCKTMRDNGYEFIFLQDSVD